MSATIVILAVGGVWMAWPSGASLAPVWLLGLLAVAVAVVVAAGGPADLVGSSRCSCGLAIGLGGWLPLHRRIGQRSIRVEASASAWRHRAAFVAGVLACAIFAVAAWAASPSVPGGDEPHYLIITQSLLKDHDLRIENNHRNGDYRAYYAGELPKPDYRRLGRNGEIYSIHAPGLPAIVAPAFAIAGYHGVVVFLILLASAGSALAWRLTYAVTGRDRCRMVWLGSRDACRSARSFTASRCIPTVLGGVITLTGVWALLRTEQERERLGTNGSVHGGCMEPRLRRCHGFTRALR